RIYPTMIQNGDGDPSHSPGWVNYTIPQANWQADYSRFLWIFEDVRVALNPPNYNENAARWHIGCAEHGMSVTTSHWGNDMSAALHWGLWLAELMRYNVEWDQNWVLCEQWFSQAQIQCANNIPTRTPGHYV